VEFIAIYRDPKKKNLQRLEILLVIVALPIALVWGARSYKEWATFKEAERLFQEGDMHLHAGRSDLALESLEKSVALYPGFYSAWETLAATYHLKNDHVKELDAYRRAVAMVPQSGELHRELGTAYHESGDHAKELEHLTKAHEILGKEEVFTRRLLDRAQREKDGTYPKITKKVPGQAATPLDEPAHGLGHEHMEGDGHQHTKP
jgi:tetratricopeptide (TPR) repeat protein